MTDLDLGRACEVRRVRPWRVLSPFSWLRAVVARYAVAPGTPIRTVCAGCGRRLLDTRTGPGLTATGRCVACGAAAGAAPWLVEGALVVAMAAIVFGNRHGAELAAYLWFAMLGAVLAVVDGMVRRLPNPLTALWSIGTLAALAIPAVLEDRGDQWLRALLAGLALMLAFGALASLRPGAMGWGDVKAAAAVGVALGWLGWIAVYGAVLLGFVLAAVYAMALLVSRRAGRGTQMPFGPFLVAGALLVVALLPTGR